MNTELADNIYHAALKILLGRNAKAFFLAPEPGKNAEQLPRRTSIYSRRIFL